MTIDTKEKRFEDIIENSLLKNKYIKRNSNNFNKAIVHFAIDPYEIHLTTHRIFC